MSDCNYDRRIDGLEDKLNDLDYDVRNNKTDLEDLIYDLRRTVLRLEAETDDLKYKIEELEETKNETYEE